MSAGDHVDVLLVSMPFGPLFSPSLGLSLLQPQVRARGLSCRVEYFTLPFAERIGQTLYSKIASEHRAMSRAFVGEWIFSHALFDWSRARDQRYVDDVLMKPPSWLGRNITRPPGRADLRAILAARSAAAAFVDGCADRIVDARPAIVGFTSVFQQHLASLALAKRVKARLPDTVIVMGGANCEATMGVETIRQFPFVDAIVSGEADHVFAELAARVVRGAPIDDVPGVVTPRSIAAAGPAMRPPTAPAVTDLDALPYPDYGDFFARFRESRFDRTWQPSVFVETSRGCWWGERMHCTFCGLNGATMAYRSKSAARALDELTHLATAHPGCDIQVVDNILDLKYFKTLLPALARRKLDVTLFYETKSNLKKDQVRLLRDAGVTTIQPGIESFSDPVLKQMKKGVSGLQNIQLLKWCKEIGVEPIWNFLLGFPGESPDDYARMADLASRVCHLPCPIGVTAIRLDRFSPNFNDSTQLGFTKVRPLPFYEFIYDLPEAARRNLAYYFAYDYRRPQDVARYAEPLVKSVHAWKTTWRNAELVSIDLDDRLMIFDTRPRAAAPLSVLRGEDRELYLAGDAITESAQVDASSAGRLTSLADRGLMIAEGGKYLSLAVPIGEYQPSGAAAARLRRMFRSIGTPDRHGVRINVGVGAERARPSRARPTSRPTPAPTAAPLTRAHFELSRANELYVRRSVG
ncbi:MAG: RiPP maturation radical SAM C-methyltransferase [Acidobacteriia bacterium]|nr:RiPP maturation radical SAM C-methyltransferase [Terriglobia bacterium]